MGGDGGVVATQKRFMRGYKDPQEKEDNKNVKEDLRTRTQTCSQSAQPLVEPIVACELGNLFSKEELLKALIEKRLNENFSHIRGLKDLKTLKLTANPSFAIGKASGEIPVARFMCPITRLEFNGVIPFVCIWSTGYVLSEKAVREVGIESLQAEYGPFSTDDIVKLVPSSGEYEEIRMKLVTKRSESKTEKKSAKRKRHDTDIPRAAVQSNQDSSASKSLQAPPPRMNMNSAQNLAAAASQEIEKQKQSSNIYGALFHKDKEADKHDRDLFMSVAGLRYTLG